MKAKPQWISSQRWVFITKAGKRVVVIMKLWLFPNEKRKEFPEGLKINWIAYNEDNATERVLFDNHHGKVLHYHIDGEKPGTPFVWISRKQVEELFWEKVQTRFGKLEKIL